ncbi:MAG TPA: hypothetical protein VJ955_02795, partial [Desulfuromonadales bacterium]|nr:hypothetical protein [Desulfuromonadales bacterium]
RFSSFLSFLSVKEKARDPLSQVRELVSIDALRLRAFHVLQRVIFKKCPKGDGNSSDHVPTQHWAFRTAVSDDGDGVYRASERGSVLLVRGHGNGQFFCGRNR